MYKSGSGAIVRNQVDAQTRPLPQAAVRDVFVLGGTGYIGQAMIKALLKRGHRVRALVRPGSEHKLPAGGTATLGDALDANSFVDAIAPADTVVHLVGVSRPNPSKAKQFEAIDLASVHASLRGARMTGVRHFVYVSVAQPAPVMHAFLAVRAEAERLVRASGIAATILRPWYVLGPGHWWPYALLPLYRLLERIPSTRASAQRLGLVRIEQMTAALVRAIEGPARRGARIVETPAIRNASR
jgi:uncharacterized protein YbjT (DUF2867 family)